MTDAVELAAEMMAEALYLPDGTPANGPRTTAAEQALIVRGVSEFVEPYWHHDYHPSEIHSYDRAILAGWRDAAAYEGELYSQAIHGANAMRGAAYLATDHPMGGVRTCLELSGNPPTCIHERERGIPAAWIDR